MKSGAVVKHLRTFAVLKTINVNGLFKSRTAPLYCSLVYTHLAELALLRNPRESVCLGTP